MTGMTDLENETVSGQTRSLVEHFLATNETDLSALVDLMSTDAICEINGETQTRSAAEFAVRQQADLAAGEATTEVELLVVDGDEGARIGWSTFAPHDGGESMRIRMTEWFTVTNRRISRIRDLMAPAG